MSLRLPALAVLLAAGGACYAAARLTRPIVPVERSRAPGTIALTPCRVDRVPGELRCGSYRVFEDRATRRGRMVDLQLVLAPSRSRTPAPDPLFYLVGGPGASSIETMPDMVPLLDGVRADRDQ